MEEKKIDYDELAGRSLSRIAAISDGVFAIAMTILVLDLRVPIDKTILSEGQLYNQFLIFAPTLLSYLMSFMTLGIYWTAHSLQFSLIDKSDRNLSWISIFYLMFISLLPFTTSFLSSYIDFKFPILLYWLNMLIPGLLMLMHWNYAYKHNFIKKSIEEKVLINETIIRRIYYTQASYFLAALLCFINVYLSIVTIIFIQLHLAFGIRYNRKHRLKPDH